MGSSMGELMAALRSAGELPWPISDLMGQMLRYAGLLSECSKKKGFVSNDSIDAIISDHIIDAIYASVHLPIVPTVDVGTGPGLPGVVLALLRPSVSHVLVESREAPCYFLQDVKRKMKLKNLTVVQSRVEQLDRSLDIAKLGFDSMAVVSRAYSPFESLLSDTKKLREHGSAPLFILGGVRTEERLGDSSVQIKSSVAYHPLQHDKRLVKVI